MPHPFAGPEIPNTPSSIAGNEIENNLDIEEVLVIVILRNRI